MSRGYLPRELPPPFTSAHLGALLARAPSRLPALPKKTNTSCARHNQARLEGLRRPLGLPNPQAYVDLAKVIEANWAALDGHLKSQRVSQSRPLPRKKSERAVIPLLGLREGPKLRARRWRGQRYIMRADISQFYSSIYTHSLPWALHTKAVAKKNRNNSRGRSRHGVPKSNAWSDERYPNRSRTRPSSRPRYCLPRWTRNSAGTSTSHTVSDSSTITSSGSRRSARLRTRSSSWKG